MSKKPEDNVTNYPNTIDTRVALLEMSISNINKNMVDIRNDIKDVLKSIDNKFDKLESKIDAIYFKLDSKIDNRFFWLLGLQITSFVGTLGIIAKAVHWI